MARRNGAIARRRPCGRAHHMDDDLPQSTDFLTLRITPYQDHALILAGIAPQLGRMAFFVRRPSSGSRRNFACVDLFRLVNVSWRKGNGELCYASQMQDVADYSALARDPSAYLAACDLARFALANVLPNSAMPEFFRALQVGLIRLRDGRLPADAIRTCVGLAFLKEGGWLCANALDRTSAAQCELLLRMAQGGDIPALTSENWSQLWNWTMAQLAAAECII